MLLRSLLVLLACFSLAFAITPAQAQQVQLAWDAPLQADGTPIPTWQDTNSTTAHKVANIRQ